MNVIFTCGGTGGHINPAIAVANIWRERHLSESFQNFKENSLIVELNVSVPLYFSHNGCR